MASRKDLLVKQRALTHFVDRGIVAGHAEVLVEVSVRAFASGQERPGARVPRRRVAPEGCGRLRAHLGGRRAALVSRGDGDARGGGGPARAKEQLAQGDTRRFDDENATVERVPSRAPVAPGLDSADPLDEGLCEKGVDVVLDKDVEV